MRFYVGANAQRTAEVAWSAFEAVQGEFANSDAFGTTNTMQPEPRSTQENNASNKSRPGVIRTHDQGIMSPLL
jgi:hypothetical protein